jgi:hypothetical protein
MAENKIIRQIKASNNDLYDIHAITADSATYADTAGSAENATKWAGHTFSEVENLIHGVVDTYVIPTAKSSTNGYAGVVGATTTQVSTTVGVLKGLVSNPPSNDFDKFNIGDVVLMGATSDGTKNFDRWISNVSGTGDSAVITLDVLETQVAKHHHTISIPVVSTTSANVLTGATVSSRTAQNMAYAGTNVTVVNGVSDSTAIVLTSVVHKNDGSFDLKISAGASTDYGHKHSVLSHNHTVTYDKSTVSGYASAYTYLSKTSHTPHTHTVVSVAGKTEADSTITYVTSVPKSTATFIKSVTTASTTTNTGDASPNTAEVSLTTDDIGTEITTAANGSHTHTATTTVTTSVVTYASVATSVVTSVSFTKGSLPTVATNVVTSFVASVDTSGVLSFTVPSATQSAGSLPNLNAPRESQLRTYGNPTITTTISEAGSHQHGFAHTHTIPSHKHSVTSHSHTYYKTVASETESAITALNTSTYNPHKHTNISAAGISTSDTANTFEYVYGGTTTNVVEDLTISSTSATVGNSSPETTTIYQKITGTITHPGIDFGTQKLVDMLSTTSITPAVNSNEKPVMSISTTSTSVVESVSVTSSSKKTSTNVGGE